MWSGEREGEGEEGSEVVFGLKLATFVAARESGGIEDDEIERFAVASESGEDGEDIIGIKAVAFFSVGEERFEGIGGGDGVDGPIFLASGEGFFGEIDADGFGAGEGGDEGKGAGIGEGIEEAFGGEFADEGAIGALIDEEARGVACGEIEEEAHAIFFDHRAEWGVGGAMDEGGGEAIGVLAGSPRPPRRSDCLSKRSLPPEPELGLAAAFLPIPQLELRPSCPAALASPASPCQTRPRPSRAP